MKLPVLVMGAAGFIGAALSLRLFDRSERVVVVENLNSHIGQSRLLFSIGWLSWRLEHSGRVAAS